MGNDQTRGPIDSLVWSEQLHGKVLDSIQDAVVVTDLNHVIKYWGAGAEAMYGYTAEETLHQSYYAFAGNLEVDQDAIKAFDDEVLKYGFWAGEHLQRHRNGAHFWTSARISVLKGDDGQAIGYIGIDHDITSQKKAEMELERRYKLLAAATEASQLMLVESDINVATSGALELIGKATQQDRAYIFQYHWDSVRGENLMSQRFEWCALEASPKIDNPELQGRPFDKGFSRWFELLSSGHAVHGDIQNFPASEQVILAQQNIVSLIVVPVFVHGAFWGFVGLDNCSVVWEWTPQEMAMLTSVAAALGTAITRDHGIKALKKLKITESKLEGAESRRRALLDANPDMMFLVTLDGLIVDYHEGSDHVFHLSPTDFLHQNLNQVLPPDLVQTTFECMRAAHESDQVQLITYNMEIAGHLRYFECRMVACGEAHCLGIVRDITDYRRLRDALEQRIVSLTRPLTDTESLTFEELFDLDDIQRIQDAFSQATHVASLIMKPDGRPITQPSGFTRFYNEYVRGTELGLQCGMACDAALGTLRESGPIVQPWLSVGLWDAGSGIWVGGKHVANWLIGQVRDETQGEERIRAYAQTIGADEDEMIKAFQEAPAMTQTQFKHIAQALYVMARQLSTSAYLNLQQARFIASEKEQQAQLKSMSEAVQQAQKMESVGRLAGGVAHDFNNMLMAILGNVELALERVGEQGEVYEDLMEVRKAAERSADLTRQLLAFARKQDVQPRAIDLSKAVDDLLSMLRRLIGEQVELIWKPGVEEMFVCIDPFQIDQVLTNLCVNARDAFEGAGCITIECERMDFSAEFKQAHPEAEMDIGPCVHLMVKDSGPGMEDEILEQLFEPFFTTKEIGQGTGLGLSTVYGIVMQNKGFIRVESELGKGSTFHIYLPAHEPPSPVVVREAPSENMPSENGVVVLLVEDEHFILKLTSKMLEKSGYVVLTAATPREALSRAQEQHGAIHLLISDMIMPEMNGQQLAEELKSLCSGLSCLFMSGYSAEVIAHQSQRNSGTHFLQKPFTKEALLRAVSTALNQE